MLTSNTQRSLGYNSCQEVCAEQTDISRICECILKVQDIMPK